MFFEPWPNSCLRSISLRLGPWEAREEGDGVAIADMEGRLGEAMDGCAIAEFATPGTIVALDCFREECMETMDFGAVGSLDAALGGGTAHGAFIAESIAAAWEGFMPYGTATRSEVTPAAMRAEERARSTEYCMVAEVPYNLLSCLVGVEWWRRCRLVGVVGCRRGRH